MPNNLLLYLLLTLFAFNACSADDGHKMNKELSMKKQKWSPLDWLSKHIEGSDQIRLQNGKIATINWIFQMPYEPFPSGQGMHGFIPIVGGITIGRQGAMTFTNVSDPEMPLLKIENGYTLELLNKIDKIWYRVVCVKDPDNDRKYSYLFAKTMNHKWVDIPRTEFPKQIAMLNYPYLRIDTNNPLFDHYYKNSSSISRTVFEYAEQLEFWFYLLTGRYSETINLDVPESEARAFFETYIKPNWKFKDQLENKDSVGPSAK